MSYEVVEPFLEPEPLQSEPLEESRRHVRRGLELLGGVILVGCLVAEGGDGAGGAGKGAGGRPECNEAAYDIARNQAGNAVARADIIPRGGNEEISMYSCAMSKYKRPAIFRTEQFAGKLVGTKCVVAVEATKDKNGIHWKIKGFGNGSVDDEIWEPFKNLYSPSRIPIITAARNGGQPAKFAAKNCTKGSGL